MKSKNTCFSLIIKILYFLLPLPVTWLSLSLMSLYLDYYDIGINMKANNLYLLMFVSPALLLSLYIIAAVTMFLSKRIFKSQRPGLFIGASIVIMAGISAFVIHDYRLTDYPTEKPKNMVLLLKYYISEIHK